MSAAAKADNTPTKEQKPAAALEEDDEFEDFPAEGTSLNMMKAVHHEPMGMSS